MGHWSGDELQPGRHLSPCLLSYKPHNDGNINPVPPRLSYTSPHSCVILNQNVNGLGKNSDRKLEKLIELMVDQKIHGYFL